MNIYERIEGVRAQFRLNKGEICQQLGIGRTMLHYIKTGERELGSKALRMLEQLEAQLSAGLATPQPTAQPEGEAPPADEHTLQQQVIILSEQVTTYRSQIEFLQEKLQRLTALNQQMMEVAAEPMPSTSSKNTKP